jgi:ABC-type uncharacterized transport system permease subunit
MNKRNALYLDLVGIVGAALAAILIGFIVILFISDDPITAISSFLFEPFTNAFNFGTVLNKAVPLIFTGLALSVVFQAGVFSMGAEGQLYFGAFFGALAAVYLPGIPSVIHLPLILLSAIIGGALFGAIPGILKAYLNADEIVTTLMLNFIAILTVSYFLNNIFKDPASGGYARMPYVEPTAKLGKFIEGLPVHSGFLIAVVTAILIYIFLYKTKSGYELRLVGKNPLFAEYGGIHTKMIIVWSIMISGALAGLGGVVEVIGIHGTLKDYFSAGLGFDGIIIALLARNHPFGVLAASFFYAYLQVGAQTMQANSDVPRELAVIIQVLLVLFVSSQAIFSYLKQRKSNLMTGGTRYAGESLGEDH